MSLRVAAATTMVAYALLTIAGNILVPQPLGPSALGAIFEPYLVLAAVLTGGFVWIRARAATRALVVVLSVVAVARYGQAWVSTPPAVTDDSLRVATWNMLAGSHSAARVLSGVSAAGADLVGLQELEGDAVAALNQLATIFPFRSLPPDDSLADVGLLSAYPILESELWSDPPVLRAVVQPPMAHAIVVYVVHAPLGRFARWADIPVGVDVNARERAVAEIRARVDVDLADRASVIVMGDLNTTERELSYAALSPGFLDSHLDAGTGPGFTWRPWPIAALPFGLVRIDYVLSTPDLVPTSSTVNCGVPSDHCRVDATLTVTEPVTPD